MVRHFEIESTVAHLHGGAEYALNDCLDIIEFIKGKQIHIENCALVEHSNGNASLAIDARNGRLYSLVGPNDLTLDENYETKMEQLAKLRDECTPLSRAYDGLMDLNEDNFVVEDGVLPEAQLLPLGWEMPFFSFNYNIISAEPIMNIGHRLRTDPKGSSLTADNLTPSLGVRMSL